MITSAALPLLLLLFVLILPLALLVLLLLLLLRYTRAAPYRATFRTHGCIASRLGITYQGCIFGNISITIMCRDSVSRCILSALFVTSATLWTR